MLLKLFEGYNLIVVPNLRNKLAIFRKELYKKNGALVSHNLKSVDNSLKTYIVIEDSGPKIDKQLFLKALKLENYELYDNLIVKYSILKKEWATDSLLKNTIEDIKKYLYTIEGIKVDKNIQSSVSIDTCDTKRKAGNCVTKNETKKLKIDASTDEEYDDEDEEVDLDEAEHRTSKKMLSNTRELFKLNSTLDSLTNPNQLIIDYFNKMAEEYKKNGENFKYINYKKAINTIKNLDHPLTSYDEAISLPYIGKRLALKVDQINKTGKLSQLDVLRQDPRLETLQIFTGIYGVGQHIANEWYEQGLRTLEDVSKLTTLTENQKLGIKYYNDWNAKIPRDEVERHIEYIESSLQNIDSKLEIVCTGSYRRGLKECGDIDFLLMKENRNDMTELSQLLEQLYIDMEKLKYIRCSLVHIHPNMRKVFAGAKLPGYEFCRRVDFLTIPWSCRGAEMVYFTGNDILNRGMRLLAKKKGLHLNDKGLYERRGNIKHYKLIESFDERMIFEKLGVKYIEPKDRNIGSFSELEFENQNVNNKLSLQEEKKE